MTEINNLLIPVITVVVLTLIENCVNAGKGRRARQALIPVIAIVFAIVAMVFGYIYFDEIEEIVKQLYEQQKRAELLGIEIFAVNAVIFAAFVLLKIIITPIITSIWSDNDLIEMTSVNFYAYDEQYDEWFLMHKWVGFKRFLEAVVIGAVIAVGGYLGLTWYLGRESFVWTLAFPVCALIVINEIYNFLNGQTKEEWEHSILGDNADARRVSNYYKVREVLEKILPEPLLSAHTGMEYGGKQTPADLVEDLSKSEDKIDRVTAEYFTIDDRYMEADIDCVQATLQLMKRNNVVFLNPFYRDMSLYITLPLTNALLSGRKVVVITGRKSNSEDVRGWLEETLSEYSRMRSLWRVGLLSNNEPECEVGVISFPQLYDNAVINANREFFRETDFVLMIEPSLIVNTGQVALSIIAQEMQHSGVKPVYCICDRNAQGIVDTMSHLLRSEFTNVVAPPVPRCLYTGMSWDADGDFMRQSLFDKQTKYLGNGVELAAIAVKNQIPQVSWYCETKAPLRDIKWLAGQHHPTICRYMNQPSQQKSLYEKINFVPSLWSTPKSKEQFIIAEDEFCNMFNTLRAFLSRGESQSFVNVFSENYLLRDYMRCNKQMFMADPNAIPSIVPDYAKTERNTLIKLILLMALRPVTDAEIIEEFHLVGIETDDPFETLTKMLKKYTFADNSVFTVQSIRSEVDALTTMSTCQYTISKEAFEDNFADSLKNAYFILEDEKHGEGYIDSKLFSHVTQTILPGQFVTYDGKYYLVKHVSPQSGVVLRRASDLYDGRKYYRQVRSYHIDEDYKGEILSVRNVMDVEIAFVQHDFDVTTTGYLEMQDNHDLRSARLIDFTQDPLAENYTRKYHNKTVLRIKLPDTNDNIRFTICLLMSEMFRSIFPDGHQYLAVMTKRPDDIEGMLNYMVYPVSGGIEDDYIYIVEDSDIDLGLMEAVERNLMKIMETVADFLDWHFEKMRETAAKDPVPLSINYTREKEEEKKRSLFGRLAQRIRKIIGIKDEEEEKPEAPAKPEEAPVKEAPSEEKPKEENPEYTLTEEEAESEEKAPVIEKTEDEGEGDTVLETEGEKEADKEKPEEAEPVYEEETALTEDEDDPEIVHVDGTDIFDTEGLPEDNDLLEEQFKLIGITPIEKSRYQKECYLKFGFEEIDGRLRVEDVRQYLRVRGWSDNSLTKARKRDVLAKNNLDIKAVNHCDFCSLPLSGVSYEVLNDGRVRCNDCSATAISTVEEFRKLFYQALEMMEAFYGIRYRVPIRVAMADARTVAKGAGAVFKPTTGVAGRVLGFAQMKRGKYSLLIENGSPRLAATDTMVHEMTHIWQYLNWDNNTVLRTYGMGCPECTAIARGIVYEGMAMWSAIQYLYQIGETYYASQQEAIALRRNDIYGVGFKLYCEQYPLVRDSAIIQYSPFTSFPTIDPEKVRAIVKASCTEDVCKC